MKISQCMVMHLHAEQNTVSCYMTHDMQKKMQVRKSTVYHSVLYRDDSANAKTYKSKQENCQKSLGYLQALKAFIRLCTSK